MDADYRSRLVEAYTDLMRREGRTDIDFTEVTRRVSAHAGREMNSQTVSRWMRGKAQPREAEERKAFALALGVTTAWLFYNEGAKKPVVPRRVSDEARERGEAMLDRSESQPAKQRAKKRSGGAKPA